MAKFNVTDKRGSKSPGPIQTEAKPTLVTGNGAPGFARDAKSDLFLLAAGSMFGEKKFYATADAESKRFVSLVRTITQADPAWMLKFITWLRSSGNMRTAAVVASVEAACVAGDPGFVRTGRTEQGWGRQLAKAGLSRTDELGEALAYFQSSRGHKRFPKPLKRGVADAAVKLINEYSAMKYSGEGKAWTLAQVLNATHPSTNDLQQSDLFGYLVAKEYGEVEIPASLKRLITRKNLMNMTVESRRFFLNAPHCEQVFKDAGMTWEAMAGWLQGPMDKAAWEAIAPSMGYMALLRNLRNFDQAGVSDTVARQVALKLGDPAQVARAKQFPFRFLAALRAAPNLRWASALSYALDCSLQNIPTLPGRTLVMVDTSGSMSEAFSEHSEMKMWDAAALFGIALALRNEHVDLVSYSHHGKVFQVTKGADTLGELSRWGTQGYNIGAGTNTFGVLEKAYRGHDRVIILTDEQANPYYGNSDRIVPAGKHLFTFNLAGYRAAHASTSKYRHNFGGLTDACFSLIPTIEAGVAGVWPWEVSDVQV